MLFYLEFDKQVNNINIIVMAVNKYCLKHLNSVKIIFLGKILNIADNTKILFLQAYEPTVFLLIKFVSDTIIHAKLRTVLSFSQYSIL